MSPIDDVLERARNAARVGDHDKVEQLLKGYVSKMPDSREARLLLGTALAGNNKLEQAAVEFNTLLKNNPNDIEALNNMAVIYRHQGKYQDALGALLQAIEIDPTRGEFHYNIGNIHKQLGNLKAASMSYAKVIELEPSYVAAYNNLGTIYDSLKEYNKAVNIFQKGLVLDQNNPYLHYNYGLVLEARGQLEEAAEQYTTSIKSKPGWAKPMNSLGIIYLKQNDINKAQETFQRLLDTDPSNAEAWNNMGIIRAKQSLAKDAVNHYQKALELNPGFAKAAINLAHTLDDTGDLSGAVKILEDHIEQIGQNPGNIEARDQLARYYFRTGKYPQAQEQAAAALALDENDVEALRISGVTNKINGMDEQAQAAFAKILSIDPKNYSYYLDLADIHFKKKNYKQAEEYLLAHLKQASNDRETKLLLGRLYTEMGDKTRAIEIFEQLSQADPNDTEALGAAAELHRETGSLEKALQTADALVNLKGQRATSDDLSQLNKSLEFYESAVTEYSYPAREIWERNIKLAASTGVTRYVKDQPHFIDLAEATPEADEQDRFMEEPVLSANAEDDEPVEIPVLDLIDKADIDEEQEEVPEDELLTEIQPEEGFFDSPEYQPAMEDQLFQEGQAAATEESGAAAAEDREAAAAEESEAAAQDESLQEPEAAAQDESLQESEAAAQSESEAAAAEESEAEAASAQEGEGDADSLQEPETAMDFLKEAQAAAQDEPLLEPEAAAEQEILQQEQAAAQDEPILEPEAAATEEPLQELLQQSEAGATEEPLQELLQQSKAGAEPEPLQQFFQQPELASTQEILKQKQPAAQQELLLNSQSALAHPGMTIPITFKVSVEQVLPVQSAIVEPVMPEPVPEPALQQPVIPEPESAIIEPEETKEEDTDADLADDGQIIADNVPADEAEAVLSRIADLLNYLVSLTEYIPEEDKSAFEESEIQSKVKSLFQALGKTVHG